MILGMSTHVFTVVHVIISLIGIASGLIVLFAMFASRRLGGWTALFLFTTILTNVTGLLFRSTASRRRSASASYRRSYC
jgi:nucleoside recognition membrane protein YjiH